MDMEIASTHRFAPNTAGNSSGQLWIASILCLIYSTLVLTVRLHIKRGLYGIDDAAITIATVLQLGDNVALFIALKQGLGDSTQRFASDELVAMGKATFAAQLFFFLALGASKLSVTALMLRLFTRDIKVTRKSRILCYMTIAVILLWALGSIVGMAVSCSPSALAQMEQANQCSTRLLQWKITAIFDILTELLLVSLPILFVWPIQMKRKIKTQIAVAFGFRLPLVALAALHLHYVSKYSHAAKNSQAMIPALVLQQCELLWSLITATIPTLKKFMRAFSSGFGMEIDLDSPHYYRSYAHNDRTNLARSTEGSEGFTLPVSPDLRTRNHHGDISIVRVPRETHGYGSEEETSGRSEPGTRPQSTYTSHSSREMIIRREVEWRISYEDKERKKSRDT